ncbi:MAG: hypothetical protein K9N46_02855 [Candidatus Marinimicrobia bacterium]|nr:hypothetical protein [Candidatus Neomarinimicrobiota bacterium]MCF7828163.1 hypothetical protein [Candidatus Neomarinimicrobiota bacterium]MCF7879662.1 hypothetical protein [Candidatus Neomarinimicrobiota bacterium]
MNKSFLICLGVASAFVLTGNLQLFAQGTDEFGRYERKSISYIPAVYIPRSEAYEMKNHEIEFLIETVKDYIEMPRFDYNELPEEITDTFVKRARKKGGVTPSEMKELLNETVVPVIMDILNTQAEIRARDLVTDEQKEQFIATKAQSYGINADQLETILNSAYLYIPYVDWVNFDKDEGMFTCTVRGGLLWFHVIPDSENPRVESLLTQETSSFGKGQDDQRYSFRSKLLDGDEFALYSAVDNFARNLQVATQSIPEFQLTGMVQYVNKQKVDFDLGRREGIKVDDGFFIKEQYQSGDGEIDQRKVGFVRTVSVGDNTDDQIAASQAVAVTGNEFTRGMALVEHPRLPLDISFRIRTLNYNLYKNSGYIAIDFPFTKTEILEAYFVESYSGGIPAVDLEAAYHIGRWFDVPMLLANVGATAGVVPVEVQVRTFEDHQYHWESTNPTLFQFRFGLTQKYFYRRFGLQFGADVGLSAMSATDQIWWFNEDFELEQYNISLSNRTVGGSLYGGFEMFLTPDITAGFVTGFQAYPESAAWSFDVASDSYDITNLAEDRPSYDISGRFMSVYVQYRPPALPFDPWNLIRASLGI